MRNIFKIIKDTFNEVVDDFEKDVKATTERLNLNNSNPSEESSEESFSGLELAAKAGNSKAIWRLAQRYEEKEEYERALELYHKIVDKNPDVPWKIANIYSNLEKPDLAKNWYRKAAENGCIEALWIVGRDYNNQGQFEKEIDLYKSFDLNNPEILNAIGDVYYNNLNNPKTAKAYYEKAVTLGNISALNGLGLIYENYLNDKEKAKPYYLEAAKYNNKFALWSLGRFAEDEEDDRLAFTYYKQAAMNGHIEAVKKALEYFDEDDFQEKIDFLLQVPHKDEEIFFEIGRIYEDDLKNPGRAMIWYEKAIELGNTSAMNNLGYLYENSFHDFEMAKRLYLQAANRGNSTAMWNLALLIEEDNFDEALNWYTKSAKLGNVEARDTVIDYYNDEKLYEEKIEFLKELARNDTDELYNIGWTYYNQLNNPALAIEWYKKAIDHGDSDATNSVGLIYQNYYNDLNKAKDYYLQASEQGNTYGPWNLGLIIEQEEGLEKALPWYKQATERGHTDAIVKVRDYYDSKNQYQEKVDYFESIVDNNPDAPFYLGWAYSEQLSNPNTAIEWYEKAIENGSTTALNNLGQIYEDYYHDIGKAKELYLQAAENNNEFALWNLGRLAENENNLKDAYYWYEKASSLNHSDAMRKMAYYYKNQGNYKDSLDLFLKIVGNDPVIMWHIGYLYQYKFNNTDLAKEWFEKSAMYGNHDALNNLGLIYEKNYIDLERARSLFEQAAKQGNFYSMWNLGRLAEDEDEFEEAYFWYDQAAQKGHSSAQLKMADKYMEEMNYQLALNYYQNLYENNNSIYLKIVECYEELEDYQSALDWLIKAYNKGIPDLDFRIVDIYYEKLNKPNEALNWINDNNSNEALRYKGKIFKEAFQDYPKAYDYYLKAAQSGDAESMFNVGILAQVHFNNQAMAQYWFDLAVDNGYIDTNIMIIPNDD